MLPAAERPSGSARCLQRRLPTPSPPLLRLLRRRRPAAAPPRPAAPAREVTCAPPRSLPAAILEGHGPLLGDARPGAERGPLEAPRRARPSARPPPRLAEPPGPARGAFPAGRGTDRSRTTQNLKIKLPPRPSGGADGETQRGEKQMGTAQRREERCDGGRRAQRGVLQQR